MPLRTLVVQTAVPDAAKSKKKKKPTKKKKPANAPTSTGTGSGSGGSGGGAPPTLTVTAAHSVPTGRCDVVGLNHSSDLQSDGTLSVGSLTVTASAGLVQISITVSGLTEPFARSFPVEVLRSERVASLNVLIPAPMPIAAGDTLPSFEVLFSRALPPSDRSLVHPFLTREYPYNK